MKKIKLMLSSISYKEEIIEVEDDASEVEIYEYLHDWVAQYIDAGMEYIEDDE